tara:strand:+ start:672 stop:1166 length:495 start_codon:yes stop_codon:yes gene_type:complete
MSITNSQFKNTRFKNEIAIFEGQRRTSNDWVVDSENNILMDYSNDIAHFASIIDNETIVTVEIKINTNYPFNPPMVKVDSKDYISQLKIDSSLTGNTCPCCSSILCHNKWKPGYGLFDILKEVHQNYALIIQSKNLEIRRREIKYSKIIMKRIFGTYLPIPQFL